MSSWVLKTHLNARDSFLTLNEKKSGKKICHFVYTSWKKVINEFDLPLSNFWSSCWFLFPWLFRESILGSWNVSSLRFFAKLRCANMKAIYLWKKLRLLAVWTLTLKIFRVFVQNSNQDFSWFVTFLYEMNNACRSAFSCLKAYLFLSHCSYSLFQIGQGVSAWQKMWKLKDKMEMSVLKKKLWWSR